MLAVCLFTVILAGCVYPTEPYVPSHYEQCQGDGGWPEFKRAWTERIDENFTRRISVWACVDHAVPTVLYEYEVDGRAVYNPVEREQPPGGTRGV